MRAGPRIEALSRERLAWVLVHAKAGWFVLGLGRNGAEYSVRLMAALLAVALAGAQSKR